MKMLSKCQTTWIWVKCGVTRGLIQIQAVSYETKDVSGGAKG